VHFRKHLFQDNLPVKYKSTKEKNGSITQGIKINWKHERDYNTNDTFFKSCLPCYLPTSLLLSRSGRWSI